MTRIADVFKPHRARSDLFHRYEPGDVPYVGNGLTDNAVVGFVKPLPIDKVFSFSGVTVSAFCEATVQVPPFIACGRAGNGLVVLEPRKAMTIGQLAYTAAYINLAVRWRFSWYWQTTLDRIVKLEIPTAILDIAFPVRKLLPKMSKPQPNTDRLRMERFSLASIYHLQAGDYHSVGNLPAGSIPVVSCGDLDNGVCGYFAIDDHVYDHKLTIAFNGATLSAKYHPYEFAAKDDVAICTPIKPLRLTTELFIQVMLQREQWRFSYYRKCYKEKLERVTVPLLARNGQIDEDAIEQLMQSTPYWEFLRERLHTKS